MQNLSKNIPISQLKAFKEVACHFENSNSYKILKKKLAVQPQKYAAIKILKHTFGTK